MFVVEIEKNHTNEKTEQIDSFLTVNEFGGFFLWANCYNGNSKR